MLFSFFACYYEELSVEIYEMIYLCCDKKRKQHANLIKLNLI